MLRHSLFSIMQSSVYTITCCVMKEDAVAEFCRPEMNYSILDEYFNNKNAGTALADWYAWI